MSNRITVSELSKTSIEKLVDTPLDQIKMLIEDMEEIEATLKSNKLKVQSSLNVRFGETSQKLRAKYGKDTGTVRITEGELVVIADLTKKVEWDQDKLSEVAIMLRDKGVDPYEYITVERKVSESAYNSWPSSLAALFQPARTVSTGTPKYKIETAKKKGR